MTAADYQALAADAATETASVKAATARIAFDFNAPLPDLHIRHGRSWEPAARRYKDIDAPDLLNSTRPTKAER